MATCANENLKDYLKFFTIYLQIRSNFIETVPDNELIWIFQIFEPAFPFYVNSLPEISTEVSEQLLAELFPNTQEKLHISEFKAAGSVNCIFKFMLTFLKHTNFFRNVLRYLSTPKDYDKFFYISNSLTKIIMYYDTFDQQYVMTFIKIIVDYYEMLIESKLINDFGKAHLEVFFQFNMISDLCLLQKLSDMENLLDNELVKDLLRKELKVASFLASSSNLEKRVTGMTALNDICNLMLLSEKYNQEACKGIKWFFSLKKPIILEWLEKINIFEYIFGENIHEAILKKSSVILIFLYMNNKLTFDQIHFIWKISQDKHEAISASILHIFSDIISSFSIEHAMYLLKTINDIPLKDVTDATISILDSFSNNKYLLTKDETQINMSDNNPEKNDLNLLNVKSSTFNYDLLLTDKLTSLDSKDLSDFKSFYLKILWKFSSECAYSAGMSCQNISTAKKVLSRILLKGVFKSELEKYVKKCIYGISANHMTTTHLSVLDLIIKNMKASQPENICETTPVFGENIATFLIYLEKKYSLISTLLSVILDIKKEVIAFIDEIIYIQNIIASHNQPLDAHEILNLYETTFLNNNDMDFTEIGDHIDTHLDESLLSEITELEILRRHLIKDFLSSQVISSSVSFKENYHLIFHNFKLNLMNQNYFAITSSLLEFLKNLIFNSHIQLHQTQIEFLFQLLVVNAVNDEEMDLFFSFVSDIVKFQMLSKERYLSDALLHYILFDLVLKLDLNSLPFSAFSLFQEIFFHINSHYGNLVILAGQIADVKNFSQLVGFESIWKIYLETRIPNVCLYSQAVLVRLISILSQREDCFLVVFDKIFSNLAQCYERLYNERNTPIEIIYDETDYEQKIKKLTTLLFVANSARQILEKSKEAEGKFLKDNLSLKDKNNGANMQVIKGESGNKGDMEIDEQTIAANVHSIELFNEDKIYFLLNLLDLNIQSLNIIIWQLLSAIKYPASLVSVLTDQNLVNFKEIFDCSKPNRLLLYLKLIHCLIFGDKFFLNVSILEESKVKEWRKNLIISDGVVLMFQAVDNIITILSTSNILSTSCSTLAYIQCLQLLASWIHFFIFETVASLSDNKYQLFSILKQVIQNISHKETAPVSAEQHQNCEFEEDVSNMFFFKMIASNFHSSILFFIKNSSSPEFLSHNLSSETEVIYLHFLDALIIVNEVNPESFRETIQFEYENSVIINLLFVEKSKSVRKVVENFFKMLLQYQTVIDISTNKTGEIVVREIVSMHIVNNYKRIYSSHVYEEFFSILGHILLREKEFSCQSLAEFDVQGLPYHILNIIYQLSCKNDIDLSEMEQEQLCGNMYLLKCLCVNHQCVILNTLEQFYHTTGISVVDYIYNCLFIIQEDLLDNDYKRIKFRFSNQHIRQKAYDLLIYLIRTNDMFNKALTVNLLSHHKTLQPEISKINDLDIPFRTNSDKFIGLANYGATCYLNSLLQQLYMMPCFRRTLYSVSILDNLHLFPDLNYNPLYQIQLLFANLSCSLKKYHSPLHFINSFTHAFHNQPISTTTQQDSDEFLNILTDQMEKLAKLINQENFLEDAIKGKISNEIISLENDYPYYSESEESCMRITLDIKNKRTIEEALDLFVKMEILEGGNKYYCEKHERKIAIMKRYSIKKLSKNVIIHLKRFEFDYNIFDNVKLNDYIEFPHELDFKKWMRASIYIKNKDDPKFKDVVIEEEALEEINDPDEFRYILTGILVHSGSTIQHGHYFSFIMDQEAGKWYRFDDNAVSEFNVSDIKAESFGEDRDHANPNANASLISNSQNAYLLFYTKKECFEQKGIAQFVPSNFCSLITNENIQFLKLKTYTDHDYCHFLREILEYNLLTMKTTDKLIQKEQSMTKAQVMAEEITRMTAEICTKNHINPNDPALYYKVKDIFLKCADEINRKGVMRIESDIRKKLIKLAVYYFLEVIIHIGDKQNISEFADFITTLLDLNRTASCWVLKTMEKNPDLFTELVLVNNVSEVREGISRIITTCIFSVQRDERKYLKEVFKTLQFVDSSDIGKEYYYFQEQPRSCLMRFIKQNLYEKFDFIRPHFHKYHEFLRIISESVNSIYETVELGYACNLFKTIVYFIMNNQGQFTTNFPTMGSEGNEPNFSVIIDILATMILASVTNGIMNLHKYSIYTKFQDVNRELLHLPQDWKILLEKDVLVNSILARYHTPDSTVKLCHHLAWGDLETSLKLIENINLVLRENYKDVTAMTNLIYNTWGILEVNDAFKLLRTSAFFMLEDNTNESMAPIFDFLFSYRDEMPLKTIICLQLLGNTVIKFPHVYEYVDMYSQKLKWIFYFLQEIESTIGKKESLVIEANSEHCNFMEVFSAVYDIYCIKLKISSN